MSSESPDLNDLTEIEPRSYEPSKAIFVLECIGSFLLSALISWGVVTTIYLTCFNFR